MSAIRGIMSAAPAKQYIVLETYQNLAIQFLILLWATRRSKLSWELNVLAFSEFSLDDYETLTNVEVANSFKVISIFLNNFTLSFENLPQPLFNLQF